MATYQKEFLSESINGKQIKIAGTTSGSATLVHTAVTGTVDKDEVWIWAMNNSASHVTVTIEWGGTADPDDNIVVTIPGNSGLFLMVPGLIIQNALAINVFASTADVICISGFVNRIAP